MSLVHIWVLIGVKVPNRAQTAAGCCTAMLTDCPLSPQPHTRWDRVRSERGRHGSILCHTEEHGRADRGWRDPPAGAPGGRGQGAGLPGSETCGWQRLPGGQVRSRVETGLVSSPAAFLPCEHSVMLSQQRWFESRCCRCPAKLDHSLLMKSPFCCHRCLFLHTNCRDLPLYSWELLFGWWCGDICARIPSGFSSTPRLMILIAL